MEEGQLLLRHRVNWKQKWEDRRFRYVRGRREIGRLFTPFQVSAWVECYFWEEKQTRRVQFILENVAEKY